MCVVVSVMHYNGIIMLLGILGMGNCFLSFVYSNRVVVILVSQTCILT